jgi:hypothetical protein
MFYRPKASVAEQFRRFNAPTVLLLAQDRRNYRSGETAQFPLYVSRYEQPSSQGATLRWKLRGKKGDLAGGTHVGLTIPCGEVRLLWPISWDVPGLGQAQELRLVAWLEDTQGVVTNEWKIWCFPAERSVPEGLAVLGSEWLQRQYVGRGLPHQEPDATGGGGASPIRLIVTDRWEPKVLEHLAKGGRVLLLNPDPVFPAATTRYRPSGWDPSDPAGHVGTTFDPQHPALRSMPSEGWCDVQFYDLIQGGKAILLDKAGVAAEPIVRMIDVPQRLARKAYLFEVKVGPGRLLVSGFNFSAAAPAGDPAATYFLDELIRYVLSDEFQPHSSMPIEGPRADGAAK